MVTMKTRGFTLVELSIVLVIIGLLVGGVLSGQSLIRASQLKSVISDYQRFYAATSTFEDKFQALPGDFANAQSSWGAQGTNCSGAVGTITTTGTCNGNNNGNIDGAPGAAMSGEYLQFWRQLALAGLIEGSYTGISVVNGAENVPGTNTPRSRISNAGWGVEYQGVYPGVVNWQFAGIYGNLFVFGAYAAGSWSDSSALSPPEAWNIDTKVDDGKPGTGKVVVNDIANCTNAASVTDYNAVYALSTSSVLCSIYFLNQF